MANKRSNTSPDLEDKARYKRQRQEDEVRHNGGRLPQHTGLPNMPTSMGANGPGDGCRHATGALHTGMTFMFESLNTEAAAEKQQSADEHIQQTVKRINSDSRADQTQEQDGSVTGGAWEDYYRLREEAESFRNTLRRRLGALTDDEAPRSVGVSNSPPHDSVTRPTQSDGRYHTTS